MTAPEPHPRALARHTQQTCNDSPIDFAQLHALAGKWDRYPVCAPTPATCPSCGEPLPPLAAYCSDDCRKLAIKRSFRNLAHDPDEIPAYSFPPPGRH